MANEGQWPSMVLVDTTKISDQASATRLRTASGAAMSWFQIMWSA